MKMANPTAISVGEAAVVAVDERHRPGHEHIHGVPELARLHHRLPRHRERRLDDGDELREHRLGEAGEERVLRDGVGEEEEAHLLLQRRVEVVEDGALVDRGAHLEEALEVGEDLPLQRPRELVVLHVPPPTIH